MEWFCGKSTSIQRTDCSAVSLETNVISFVRSIGIHDGGGKPNNQMNISTFYFCPKIYIRLGSSMQCMAVGFWHFFKSVCRLWKANFKSVKSFDNFSETCASIFHIENKAHFKCTFNFSKNEGESFGKKSNHASPSPYQQPHGMCDWIECYFLVYEINATLLCRKSFVSIHAHKQTHTLTKNKSICATVCRTSRVVFFLNVHA